MDKHDEMVIAVMAFAEAVKDALGKSVSVEVKAYELIGGRKPGDKVLDTMAAAFVDEDAS